MKTVDKAVEVTLVIDGESEGDYKVGVGRAGVGNGEEKPIFGLMSRWHHEFTHMCYYIDEFFDPPKVLKKIVEKYSGYLIFNVKSPGYSEIKIHHDELERAFRELGLIE